MTRLRGVATSALLLAALGLLPSLAGCTATDPLYREGVWRPNDANDADLRAMVSQPADLLRGQDEPGSDGQEAAIAIAHLREDKPKPALSSPLQLGSSGAAGGGS